MYELPFLIEAIFSSKNEEDVVGGLQGDDAQTFIDVIDEVFLHIRLPPRNQHILPTRRWTGLTFRL